MRLFTSLLLSTIVAITIMGCTNTQDNIVVKKVERPHNIDKNNVGITAGESADQKDPTLIEGNLENNDFKN